jgi:hypothetical protein
MSIPIVTNGTKLQHDEATSSLVSPLIESSPREESKIVANSVNSLFTNFLNFINPPKSEEKANNLLNFRASKHGL